MGQVDWVSFIYSLQIKKGRNAGLSKWMQGLREFSKEVCLGKAATLEKIIWSQLPLSKIPPKNDLMCFLWRQKGSDHKN